MHPVTLLGAPLAGTATSALPINATQPMVDQQTHQTCGNYTMDQTTEPGKPLASMADCENLSFAFLNQPQGYYLTYFQDNNQGLSSNGSCHLFVAAKTCDDRGECDYKDPVKVGNGDAAVLVGKALDAIGARGNFTARGTMQCVTEDQEEPKLWMSTG